MAAMTFQQRRSAPAVADQGPEPATPQKDAHAGLRGLDYDVQSAALAPVQRKEAAGGAKDAAAKGDAAPAAKKATKAFGATDPNGLLKGTHPALQERVAKVIELAHAKGLDIWVTQGMRSIAQQNELYKQGRTKPGNVVTWVRGGGSYHNYGLAVDFAFRGATPYSEKHDWAGLVACIKAAGLESGAGYGDRPHANIKGISIASLQAWHAAGGMANVWNKVSEKVGGPEFGGGDAQKGGAEGDKPGKAGAGGDACKVKPGDTLIGIAKRLLGDGDRWEEIATLNGIRDPRALAVGATLKLPKAAAGKGDPSPTGAEKSFVQTEHTVRPGETLSGIALKFYGMSSLWTEIAAANGVKDPSALRSGQKLIIPNPGQAVKAPKQPVAITHVMKAGETLTKIALQHYGDAGRWPEIARANGIKDTRNIAIGTKLKVPM